MNCPKKKKLPCENCRDQKRKCNGQQPCIRCEKLNLACIYIQQLSPNDEEYIQLIKNSEIEKEVATLESQIKEMETEIACMKNNNNNNNKVCSVPPSYQKQQMAIATNNNNNNKPLCWTLAMTKGQLNFQTNIKTIGELFYHLQNLHQVIHFNNIVPTTMEQHTFKTALMRALNKSLQRKQNKVRYKSALLAIEYQDWNHDRCSIDFTSALSVSPTSLSSRTIITDDSNILSINNDHHTLRSTLSPSSSSSSFSFSSPSSYKKYLSLPSLRTTFSLVKKYTECQHLYQFAIHLPIFYRYFENINISNDHIPYQPNGDDDDDNNDDDYVKDDYQSISPALTAFCAVLCTFDCDHILQLVPEHHLHFYSHFYFEHAKKQVSERFDEVSLELLTSYVFMAVYKWNTFFEKESLFYADMAHRLSLLLANEYEEEQKKKKKHQHDQHCTSDMDDKDETIHFYRLISYLTHVCAYQQKTATNNIEQSCRHRDLQQLVHRFKDVASLDNNNNDNNNKQKKKRRKEERLTLTYFITWQHESHFLQYHAYRHELQLLIQQIIQSYDHHCTNFMEMAAQLSYLMDHSVLQWYQGLEEGYKLIHLSLFDSAISLSDQAYLQSLANECDHHHGRSIIPALMTLAVYDEYILMGLALLPKRKYTEDEINVSNTLHQFWHGGRDMDLLAAERLGINIMKWQNRLKKLNQMRDDIVQGDRDALTDQEFLNLVMDLLYSNHERYHYSSLYHVFLATLNTIRISQYLLYRRWKGLCCYFDKKLIIKAKLILSRLLIAGPDLDPAIFQYEAMIHEKIQLCDKMLQLDLSNLSSIIDVVQFFEA